MIYYIEPTELTPDKLLGVLEQQPNILFVSLVSVDLGNNHTDERIPIRKFKHSLAEFLSKGIQTDGSSVVLPHIADIENAKVDIIPDPSVRWFVDYNHELLDDAGQPVGTLLIPSKLYHQGQPVGSRSVLARATAVLEQEIRQLFDRHPEWYEYLGIESGIQAVELSLATELEFWVRSPFLPTDDAQLTVSQRLKEQYWKRPTGELRQALEESLLLLERYGLLPEMGHKEAGGIASQLQSSGTFTHMEQVEIVWKYERALQALDHEWLAKDIIQDIFAGYGLDVTFKAKPIEAVSGSGEHHHMSINIIDGKSQRHNLWAPAEPKQSFLNSLGYGALMGLLKHYRLINPFITNSHDALNRLKPGFEAPVNVVCSLGHSFEEPGRNRTVLVGLIRDKSRLDATRLELRSPYAGSNSYLLAAAAIAAMLDGMDYASTKNESALLEELSKASTDPAEYLDQDHQYRSEKDIFSAFDESERARRFGLPPKTVYEVIEQFETQDHAILTQHGIFTPKLLASYITSIQRTWISELGGRVIPAHIDTLRSFKILHMREPRAQIDEVRWSEIYQSIIHLMKDTEDEPSLITQIVSAIAAEDYPRVSRLQFELDQQVLLLRTKYADYKKNLIHIE